MGAGSDRELAKGGFGSIGKWNSFMFAQIYKFTITHCSVAMGKFMLCNLHLKKARGAFACFLFFVVV